MWPIAIWIAVAALTVGSVVGFALAILAVIARERDE